MKCGLSACLYTYAARMAALNLAHLMQRTRFLKEESSSTAIGAIALDACVEQYRKNAEANKATLPEVLDDTVRWHASLLGVHVPVCGSCTNYTIHDSS